MRLHVNGPWPPIRDAEQLRGVEPGAAVLLPNCTKEVAEAVRLSMPPYAEVRVLRDDAALGVPESVHTRCRQDLARALDMPEGRFFGEYVEAVRKTKANTERLSEALGLPNTADLDSCVVEAKHARETADSLSGWLANVADALGVQRGLSGAEYVEAIKVLMAEREERESVRAENGRLRAEAMRLREQRDANAAAIMEAQDLISELKDENARLERRHNGLIDDVQEAHVAMRAEADARDDALIGAYNQGCADTVAAFRKAQGGE